LQTCPLCSPTLHEVLWQDDFCRVILLNDADYPAYCRVELIEHIKEMTDLLPPQRARIMKCVFAVETAVREVIRPDKINLASLGNKTPHVHWHVIPRFENDKHFPNSHWGEVMRKVAINQKNSHALSRNDKKLLAEKIRTLIECVLSTS
jgi:diadenosine tetraphosphate (Ap4A) HIT family hydrolase